RRSNTSSSRRPWCARSPFLAATWASSCSLAWRALSPRRSARGGSSRPSLLLAGRAEEARTLPHPRHPDRGPANPARKRGAVVDGVVLLKIPRGTVGVHEVAQARSAGGYRGEKNVPHGRDQSLASRSGEAP